MGRYLDGTPDHREPVEGMASQTPARKVLQVELNEPEHMIADLLVLIHRGTGRVISGVNVTWVTVSNPDGPPECFPSNVGVTSDFGLDYTGFKTKVGPIK